MGIDVEISNKDATQLTPNKKKASFDFDEGFHTKLKIYAAKNNKSMVDIVVEAVGDYMDKNK